MISPCAGAEAPAQDGGRGTTTWCTRRDVTGQCSRSGPGRQSNSGPSPRLIHTFRRRDPPDVLALGLGLPQTDF
jgi:hypothetical protein